jgi:hypothetical protein
VSELFPAAWFASGVVTAESEADFKRYASVHPNRPARHWKWAAFRDWTEERERLTADECRAAFGLGAAEPDMNLGTAIMCRILLERACPADVRESARRSARAPVRRTAGTR